MLGSKFVRHPPLQPFTIDVVDRTHPATIHLDKIWQWEDEFYYMNQLNPDMHILLTGRLTNLDDDKKGDFPGKIFGDVFPLSWCHNYDGGREFYTALGHKAEYYQDATYRQHLLGGIKWTMNVQ
jgi:uncharacterized protein